MSSLFQTRIDRRVLLRGVAGTAALAVAGCSNAVGTNAGAELDARVDATHNYLIQNYPSAQALVQNARGVLYMPLMTEAALGADTITAQLPVVAMIFGQAGLMAGASIEGTKYTRVIPSEIPTLGFGGMGLPQMQMPQMPQMGRY